MVLRPQNSDVIRIFCMRIVLPYLWMVMVAAKIFVYHLCFNSRDEADDRLESAKKVYWNRLYLTAICEFWRNAYKTLGIILFLRFFFFQNA